MKTIRRLLFYSRKIKETVEWRWECSIHPEAKQRVMDELEAAERAVPEEMAQAMEKRIRQHRENRPELDPAATMAFHSWKDNFQCNFITSGRYRQRIRSAIQWGRSSGIKVFLADYTTPFGLLALETLLEERKKYRDFQVYVYQSRYFSKRRTYRLIRETPLEMLFLAAETDYNYGGFPIDALAHVLPKIAIHYAETGRLIIDKKLPSNCTRFSLPEK